MPIVLGTRSITNVRAGAADVYIADGGSLTLNANFGYSLSDLQWNTLIALFTRVGTIEETPRVKSDPISVNLISNGTVHKVQKGHRVSSSFGVVELDNTNIEALRNLIDNSTLIDVLFIRPGQTYVSFLRNVYPQIAIDKPFSDEAIEKATMSFEFATDTLTGAIGQIFISTGTGES
jgi:hypothetical protein